MNVASLSDIYPDDLAFKGLASSEALRWIGDDEAFRLRLSINTMLAAGSMPVLCSAAGTNPAWLDAAAAMDLGPIPPLLDAIDRREEAARIEAWIAAGGRVVTQHREPERDPAAGASWIDPTLLGRLNDKAELGDLCPAEYLPRRAAFRPAERDWNPLGLVPPYFLKAATRWSTGGGVADVWLVEGAAGERCARRALATSERVVQEELVPAREWYCLNLAVTEDGRAGRIGAATMTSTREGGFLGNRLGTGVDAPAAAWQACEQITRRGAELGYSGVIGIDVGVDATGRCWVIDANFRLCASTTPLLKWSTIADATGATIGCTATYTARAAAAVALGQAVDLHRSGHFAPLSFFDPARIGLASQPCIVHGLVLATDRGGIEVSRQTIARLGWS